MNIKCSSFKYHFLLLLFFSPIESEFLYCTSSLLTSPNIYSPDIPFSSSFSPTYSDTFVSINQFFKSIILILLDIAQILPHLHNVIYFTTTAASIFVYFFFNSCFFFFFYTSTDFFSPTFSTTFVSSSYLRVSYMFLPYILNLAQYLILLLLLTALASSTSTLMHMLLPVRLYDVCYIVFPLFYASL